MLAFNNWVPLLGCFDGFHSVWEPKIFCKMGGSKEWTRWMFEKCGEKGPGEFTVELFFTHLCKTVPGTCHGCCLTCRVVYTDLLPPGGDGAVMPIIVGTVVNQASGYSLHFFVS